MAVVGVNWVPFREEFPILFSSKSVISMWVGEGWFELMWCLSSKLETISRRLVAEGKAPVRFIQVKESDGGLRCYVENGTDEVELVLLEAQARSLSTCEACGRPGCLVIQNGWYKTLCPRHELEP